MKVISYWDKFGGRRFGVLLGAAGKRKGKPHSRVFVTGSAEVIRIRDADVIDTTPTYHGEAYPLRRAYKHIKVILKERAGADGLRRCKKAAKEIRTYLESSDHA